MDRLGLTAKGIEPGMVEIGSGEAWVPCRQKAPWTIVKAFARYVHIVCVEHAVNKACNHQAGGKVSHALNHLMQENGGWFLASRRAFWRHRPGELRKAILRQLLHFLGQFERE